jgi:hypothetical protein
VFTEAPTSANIKHELNVIFESERRIVAMFNTLQTLSPKNEEVFWIDNCGKREERIRYMRD